MDGARVPNAADQDWPTGAREGFLPELLRYFVRLIERLVRFAGRHAIILDYPPSSALRPRYGFGAPPHPGLEARLTKDIGRFEVALREAVSALEDLRDVPRDERTGDDGPHWANLWLTGLDAVSLYMYVRQRNPARYMEIGSGVSTRWVRKAVRDSQSRTHITSIDPAPRRDIAHLADEVLRTPLELADLRVFEALEDGDIVFMDGSHRVFTGSDATVFLLDVVPTLAAGVLVGVHDILLPFDYPPPWRQRYYSEQYLLASYFLGGGAGAQIILPSYFVSTHPILGGTWKEAWDSLGPPGVDSKGLTFWFETADQARFQ